MTKKKQSTGRKAAEQATKDVASWPKWKQEQFENASPFSDKNWKLKMPAKKPAKKPTKKSDPDVRYVWDRIGQGYSKEIFDFDMTYCDVLEGPATAKTIPECLKEIEKINKNNNLGLENDGDIVIYEVRPVKVLRRKKDTSTDLLSRFDDVKPEEY